MKESFGSGGQSVTGEGGSSDAATSSSATTEGPPAWAKRMKRSQAMSHGIQAADHAVKSGDSHGGSSSVHLSESDR